jgi:hypothetical protein
MRHNRDQQQAKREMDTPQPPHKRTRLNEAYAVDSKDNFSVPQRETWKLIHAFGTEADMLGYFTYKVPRNAITHRNKSKCSLCKSMKGDDDHKMQVAYRSCTSKTCSDRCTVKYKVIMCEKDSIYNCYKIGEHALNDPNLVDSPSSIHPQVKAYIYNMVRTRMVVARRILANLKRNRDKFDTSAVLPTLGQIQSYTNRVKENLELDPTLNFPNDSGKY